MHERTPILHFFPLRKKLSFYKIHFGKCSIIYIPTLLLGFVVLAYVNLGEGNEQDEQYPSLKRLCFFVK